MGKTDPAHPRPDPTSPKVQAIIDSRNGGWFCATDPVWLSRARLTPADYDGPPPGAGRVPRLVLYAAESKQAARVTEAFWPLMEPRVRTPPDERSLLIARLDGYIGFAGRANTWDKVERF